MLAIYPDHLLFLPELLVAEAVHGTCSLWPSLEVVRPQMNTIFKLQGWQHILSATGAAYFLV